jgi:hypothetical protein
VTTRRTPAFLSARRRRIVYVLLLGLWSSGTLWWVLHTFFQRSGEFGPVAHPLTPLVLMIHAAFAMASLAVLGLVWGVHVLPAWRRGNRRPTGILTLALFVVLAGSGYVLYYASDETVRNVTSTIHWALGLLAIVPFVVHALRKPIDPQQRSVRADAEPTRHG